MIGESLGLTTLETIIVVLLGAIFAGIPGMILALPAASVIKYLVPQIYHAWAAHPEAGRRWRNERTEPAASGGARRRRLLLAAVPAKSR